MQKVSVTERALAARVHRHIEKKHGQALRKNKAGTAAFEQLGKYYVTNEAGVVKPHVDLEAYARDLKLLDPWEELES